MGKIKVLHVIGAMDKGGAETMIMNFFKKINREEIQFDFLVHEERECDYDKEILALGGKIYRLPRLTAINYFAYKKACKVFFEKNKFDIVHGHIGSSAAIYLSEAKKHGMKTIAHSHAVSFGYSISSFVFRFMSYPTRFIADYFIGCSHQASIDRFGKKVAHSGKNMILSNGIDCKAYIFDKRIRDKKRQELGINQELVIGHVGRFANEKNHVFLIKVFAELCKKRDDVKLLLIGRGPLEDKIKETVNRLGLKDKVFFLGVRNDINELLMAMDVFVFPSKFEGLGIALIEAQATGLPCVVSKNITNEACILDDLVKLDFKDIDLWIENIRLANTNKDRSKDIKKIVDYGFDSQNSVDQLTKLYKELIK